MTSELQIGDIVLNVLTDARDRVGPETILAGAPPAVLSSILRGHVDRQGQLAVAYNGLLIRSAGRTVLVDAGFGAAAGDRLAAELAHLGVTTADVDVVVVSHGHADHIGGLTQAVDGRQLPRYDSAAHWFWREEWAHWTSDAVLAALPPFLADPARTVLPTLAAADRIRLTHRAAEVADGVRLIGAPGHTPGHAAVAVESGGERAIYVGDAVFHPLNVEHPDWGCVFDVDLEAAVRTRRRLLDRAATDGALLLAAHLLHPARVERSAGGFRLVSAD